MTTLMCVGQTLSAIDMVVWMGMWQPTSCFEPWVLTTSKLCLASTIAVVVVILPVDCSPDGEIRPRGGDSTSGQLRR